MTNKGVIVGEANVIDQGIIGSAEQIFEQVMKDQMKLW